MPATTRSKTKQTHLEDFESKLAKGDKDSASSQAPKTSKTKKEPENVTTSKRKRPEHKGTQGQDAPSTNKKQKSSKSTTSKEDKPIMINRSPVLQLWSACVSQALYPDLPWPTHLAVGSAISTLCAISKGRSIGTIEPAADTDDQKAKKDAKKRAAEEGADDEVQVMRFRLLLKDGAAIVSGSPKRANEALLKSKFGGDEQYENVKGVMAQAIASWSDTRALDAKAFGMYEDFRPNVSAGQGGWGKKGELSLEHVREVVEKTS